MQASNEHHFDELDTDGLRQALDVRRGAGLLADGLPELPAGYRLFQRISMFSLFGFKPQKALRLDPQSDTALNGLART